MHKNNTLMLVLTAISSFCLLVLAGLYAYTGGSILPQTQNAPPREVWELWITWSAFVLIPTVTAVLWLLRYWTRRKS